MNSLSKDVGAQYIPLWGLRLCFANAAIDEVTKSELLVLPPKYNNSRARVPSVPYAAILANQPSKLPSTLKMQKRNGLPCEKLRS
jgi:hypothetical protein